MSSLLTGLFLFLFSWTLLTANHDVMQLLGVIFYLTFTCLLLVAGLLLMHMKVNLSKDLIKSIVASRPDHFRSLYSFKYHKLTVSFLTVFAMSLTAINNDYNKLSLVLLFSYIFSTANYIMYRKKFLNYCKILGFYGYGQRRF